MDHVVLTSGELPGWPLIGPKVRVFRRGDGRALREMIGGVTGELRWAEKDTIGPIIARWALGSARVVRRRPRVLLVLLLDVVLVLGPFVVVCAVIGRLSSLANWSGVFAGVVLGAWVRSLTAAQRAYEAPVTPREHKAPERPV